MHFTNRQETRQCRFYSILLIDIHFAGRFQRTYKMFGIVRTHLSHLRVVQRSWEPISATGSLQIQQVRWRKRRTDPKAKSKIGKVREPTPWDPWERAFLVEKIPHYNSTMNAVR